MYQERANIKLKTNLLISVKFQIEYKLCHSDVVIEIITFKFETMFCTYFKAN